MEKEKEKEIKWKVYLLSVFLLVFLIGEFLVFWQIENVKADTTISEELAVDYDSYEKYEKYLKYKKREKYREYKEAKEKYAFKDMKERLYYKSQYEKYRLYKKDPVKYQQYVGLWDDYKLYRGYKNKYKPLKKYSKYKKYNQSKYGKSQYKSYGSAFYKAGWERYKSFKNNEANLGGSALGPVISVGIMSYDKSYSKSHPFTFTANKNYRIKDKNGNIIRDVVSSTKTEVAYLGDGYLKIFGDSGTEVLAFEYVDLEPQDGNSDDMIFKIEPSPQLSFNEYRGKIRVRHVDVKDKIWVINILPLEHYVWGMGEITGTGDADYNRVMTTSFRTYGYWKIKFSTKYAVEGFKVDATPGNQLYYGYDWEKGHTEIRDAAIETRGRIAMYGDRIAITPYSSWTDGRTRSWVERWGSENYPWCVSVADPYGKHPTKSTATLEAEGNHMVGLSANGALKLAGDHNWDWDRIMKYYYTGINLNLVY